MKLTADGRELQSADREKDNQERDRRLNYKEWGGRRRAYNVYSQERESRDWEILASWEKKYGRYLK